MANNNFVLSPEDRLLWQQRAPRASFWFRVSDTHPFINNGQPVGTMTQPPPPYTPVQPPAYPGPVFEPYPGYGQPASSIPGMIHPGTVIPPPLANTVPIYDVRDRNRDHTEPIYDVRDRDRMELIYDVHRSNRTEPTNANEIVHPSVPSRKLDFSSVYSALNNTIVLGFTVFVPVKQSRCNDTPS
jgi:hypothetical protein